MSHTDSVFQRAVTKLLTEIFDGPSDAEAYILNRAGNAQPLQTSSGAGFATISARKLIHGGKLSPFAANGMTSTRQALSQRSHTPRITWVRFARSSQRLVNQRIGQFVQTFGSSSVTGCESLW